MCDLNALTLTQTPVVAKETKANDRKCFQCFLYF